jgi:hypothetical protein
MKHYLLLIILLNNKRVIEFIDKNTFVSEIFSSLKPFLKKYPMFSKKFKVSMFHYFVKRYHMKQKIF